MATICLVMFRWLVELWFTNSPDLAPLIKNLKFSQNFVGTLFLLAKLKKKDGSHPPPSFSEKSS